MKVIHLIGGGDTGGAKTHVLHLLRELNQSLDARLFCFRQGEFSQDAQRMGIPVEVIDGSDLLKSLRELKRRLGNEKVDVIHCHGARGNLMGKLIQGYLKAPVITTVHSDYRKDYVGRPAARLFYGTTNTLALRRMDYYIAVADVMAELLIDRNFPAGRIFTMYNGIDFTPPAHIVPREEFLRSLGLEVREGDVVAGIAARLTPVKDYPTLLRAVRKAAEEVPQLKLVAAGDGEDREKLEQLARELGIEDRVCFAGWVKDTDSFFSAIDINLLTSVTEGFPYVLPEGARMRRATVSSNVGGVPAIIEDGLTGLLFEPGDADRLAQHLVTLARDARLREKLGEQLYDSAREKFSMEKMVRVQLDIYDTVLQREARKQRFPKRDGAIICGAYGHGNAGDEAILKSIIQSVRQVDETLPITVLAKNTESIKKRFRVDSIYTLSIPRILWAMRRSRLYINGGGTLIQNATSHRSLWYYLFTLRAAHFLGNKVDMYGCGIGPVNGKGNIRLVRRVLNRSVDKITLREPESLAELKSYGVTGPEIVLSSDPALALGRASPEETEAYLRRHGVDPQGNYLCFMLRSWYGFADRAQEIAKAADYAYERYGLTPLFLSLNVFYDSKAARQVAPFMKAPLLLIDDGAEPEMLISALSAMRVVVAMRLHGLILSSLSGVPLVGVSYDPKIGAFLRYLGSGSCFELDGVTAEQLIPAIDRAVEEIPRREELRDQAERLMAVERRNIQAVQELLEGPK